MSKEPGQRGALLFNHSRINLVGLTFKHVDFHRAAETVFEGIVQKCTFVNCRAFIDGEDVSIFQFFHGNEGSIVFESGVINLMMSPAIRAAKEPE